jgi:L-2-hydroxycarboxylate dehydrogenase (NAD+)
LKNQSRTKTEKAELMTAAAPVRHEELSDLLNAIFQAAGASSADARVVANQLVDAEMRESKSQGLIRLKPYVAWSRKGEISSPTKVTVEREFGSTLLLNGNHGWGQVAALEAMQLCIQRARTHGVCLAVMRNIKHIGRQGSYVEAAAKQGLVGLIACSGNPSSGWVAPWGGTKPIFGTNPIAFGFPRKGQPPVIVDLSTTQGARGHVLMAQKLGNLLPEGWAFDAQGAPTRDPHKALPPHGTLAPLGGHKGYALALAIEILCGVLGGMWPPKEGATLVGAINIEAFQKSDDYYRSLENLLCEISSTPKAKEADAVLLPGEGSARRYKRSLEQGLQIPDELWKDIKSLADDLGVKHHLLA